jgi:hypothetical protein
MVFKLVLSLICFSLLSALTFATPVMDIQDLEARQAPDNIVYITDANIFWQVTLPTASNDGLDNHFLQFRSMIMPRSANLCSNLSAKF